MMKNRWVFCVLPAVALTAACADDPASPDLERSVFRLLGQAEDLEVGEALTVAGPEAARLTLQGEAEGAEYLYVPFHASTSGAARLGIEIMGLNVQEPTGPPDPAVAPSPGLDLLHDHHHHADGPEVPPVDYDFKEWIRDVEVRELAPRVRPGPARGDGPAFQRQATAARQAVPVVGDVLELNVSLAPCENADIREGRVAAVTEEAIVVHDVSNPDGGFTDEEYREFGIAFDTLAYPINVDTFGEPTDIDGNDRVILFYTRAVNDLTDAGSGSFVAGFFFARDLFPRQDDPPRFQGCPTSNEAEIFYLQVPDPDRENVFQKDFISERTVGTIGHEFQHLVNAARRLYINTASEPFEETWLNEALSHTVEELMFYRVSGMEPRQNIDLQALTSSQRRVDAVNRYQVPNFGRYGSYVQGPDTASLIGPDGLATRGAAWSFLRYALDQASEPENDLLFDLLNAQNTGLDNLSETFGVSDPFDLIEPWSAAVYVDGAVPNLDPLYTQPSWDFRSLLSAIRQDDRFPLDVRSLTDGEETTFNLRGGSAAYVRFGVAAGQEATITTTSGGLAPEDGLRVTVIRIR